MKIITIMVTGLLGVMLHFGAIASESKERDGHIDRIDGQHLVINDGSFLLTPLTRISNNKGVLIKQASLQEGMYVKFHQDDNAILLSLTVGEMKPKQSREKADQTISDESKQTPSPDDAVLIQEDGVWRN
jgi:hypothetical protein